LTTAGACVSVLAVYAGNEPAPLPSSLHGTSVSAVVVLVAFIWCGSWVLRTAPPSAWRWAAAIAAALSTAQLAGLVVRKLGGRADLLLARDNLGWVAVHWIGIGWMVSCGLAALIWAIDAHDLRSSSDGALVQPGGTRWWARLTGLLRATDRAQRRKGLLTVMGILVLSRVPYLVTYWPGIMMFDTIRSYSYARGTVPWDSYEPVGHSLLIAVMQWLGTHLGWGDVGGLAIGSITAVLASSAAFTFMLGRMAVWQLHPSIWAATLAWLVLLPIFGIYSVQLVKDVPFSIAMVVFLVCVGELSFGRSKTAGRWWPWVTLGGAAVFAFMMRNNGIHVMVLSLPLLLIPLSHYRRRILIVITGVVASYALFIGPVYALLDVGPGPKEEAYSVPLQQLGHIAQLHSAELSPADREFYLRTFDGMSAEELGTHYIPWLADPMKLTARRSWADHSTTEFLFGWARIAAKHPLTAIGATLNNTVGYWDPEGPSFDGINRSTANDARLIHLDIPSGDPTAGLSGAIEASGFFPTRSNSDGLHDDGYRAIPVLGLALSPGPICWLWLIAALLVIRRHNRTALALFAPVAALLLSFLAGPVSGGQRYALTLFMALPLAVAAVALATPGAGKESGFGRVLVGRIPTPSEAGRAIRSQAVVASRLCVAPLAEGWSGLRRTMGHRPGAAWPTDSAPLNRDGASDRDGASRLSRVAASYSWTPRSPEPPEPTDDACADDRSGLSQRTS
jgi:hypothetical protein